MNFSNKIENYQVLNILINKIKGVVKKMGVSRDQIMKMLSKQLGISATTTTFGEVVKTKAEKVGDKVYLTFVRDFDKGIDEKYTYRDMHVLSNKLANGLLKLGIKQRDGISILQINSPEYLFVLFAAFKMGCYCVLVNTGLKGSGTK
ncbi:unnamed protein product [marine sediment metagenome]|uniref:AMP-dependent synthetase/ligase domain-containing protein n=1 Tax=marine sediment metagenome TaxID=412755 RepID=X1CX35_9ZZZZ